MFCRFIFIIAHTVVDFVGLRLIYCNTLTNKFLQAMITKAAGVFMVVLYVVLLKEL